MIKISSVEAIGKEKIYFRTLKVERLAADIYRVISYHYRDPEIRYTGYAEEVVKFLNGWFGNPWECENSACEEMADGPGLCKECDAYETNLNAEDWGAGR